MKPRVVTETAIFCATGLAAFALAVYGLNLTHANGKAMAWFLLVTVIGAGLVAWSRYLVTKKGPRSN